MSRKCQPGERSYCGGLHSICWRCRRSNADLAANPEGYCRLLAEGRLPDGALIAVMQKYGSHLQVVVQCPQFDKLNDR